MPEARIPATSSITLPFQKLAKLLSQCATFRTLLGAADADAAYDLTDLIIWDAADDDTSDDGEFQTLRVPGATVTQVDALNMAMDIRSGGTVGISQGELLLEIRAAPDPVYTRRDNQLIAFGNSLGEILKEAFALSETLDGDGGNHLRMVEPISAVILPQFTDPDEEPDRDGNAYVVAAFNVPFQL